MYEILKDQIKCLFEKIKFISIIIDSLENEHKYIPLKGTDEGFPVTGPIKWQQPESPFYTVLENNSDEGFFISQTNSDNSDTTTVIVNTGEVTINSTRPTSRGLVAAKDFMPYATDETYVTKRFVDAAIGSIAPTNQNLQQTLDLGETAEWDSSQSTVILGKELSTNNRIIRTKIGDTVNINRGTDLTIVKESGFLTHTNIAGNLTGVVGVNDNGPLTQVVGAGGSTVARTDVSFNIPTAVTSIKYPAKPAGNYTVAMLSDITNTEVTFIKSDEPLSGAYRKDDTIFGILDKNTGEEMTLQIINFTPIVDNIMFFELDGDYFQRVYKQYVDVRWFGAKIDGITDDTQAIQNTINFVYNIGGGNVYLPNGIYLIAGPLVTSDNIGNNPNSQIYIPSNNPLYQGGTGQPITVNIIGEAPPTFVESGFIDSKANLFTEGVILKSTLPYSSISGILPAVFGTKGITDMYGSFNLIDIKFENIWVRTHHDSTHGTYLSAFNMLDASFTKFITCRADTDVAGYNTVAPTGMSIGFAGARSNGGTKCEFRECLVCTYTIGYEIGEHSILDDTNAFFCRYGFDFGKAGHSSTVYHALSQWNQTSISFNKYDTGYGTTFHFVNNYGMVVENTALGKWYDTVIDVDDPTSGLEGNIFFTKTVSGMGVFDNTILTKLGATKVTCSHVTRPIAALEHDGRLFINRALQVTRQGDIIGDASSHVAALTMSADGNLNGAAMFSPNTYEPFKVTGYRNDVGIFIDYVNIGSDLATFRGEVRALPATNSNHLVTKGQLDTKSDLASPSFTGIPTAPTAITSTNNTQIATTAFVKASGAAQIIVQPNTTPLTIVPTSKTIMVTYTGTTNTTTLPAVIGNEGSVLFLTNAGSGTITINSNTGANDIWDGNSLMSTTNVSAGIIARMINDGIKWRLI